MTLYGIYCYMDKDGNDSIVYIGKDTSIDKHLRRRQHLQPSRRNHQPINRILQNNPNRYYYKVLSVYNPSFKPKLNRKVLNGLNFKRRDYIYETRSNYWNIKITSKGN